MTIIAHYQCDGDDCDVKSPRLPQGKELPEFWRSLKGSGWATWKGKHYCPNCTYEKENGRRI